VNLELPIRAGTPLGGHIVQGHVDGMGRLLALTPAMSRDGKHGANATPDWWMRIRLPRELHKYVVEKGSITIEGISLTVAKIAGDEITVAIIPHTYRATNLHTLRPGASLNIEVDVLAKYAEKRVHSNITMKRLKAEGF
jgi:riboflavin synthase